MLHIPCFHVSQVFLLKHNIDKRCLTIADQGQGGAQALEDGIALGTIFSAETTPNEVSGKLDLFNKVRYKRAITVMFMSGIRNDKRAEKMPELLEYVPDATLPVDMFEYTWNSYVAQDSQSALEAEWRG